MDSFTETHVNIKANTTLLMTSVLYKFHTDHYVILKEKDTVDTNQQEIMFI